MAKDKVLCPNCCTEINPNAKKCIQCGEFVEKNVGWTGFKGKTLWDWMKLLVVPLALLLLGVIFSLIQSDVQNKIEDRRATAQAVVELDRSQDAILQRYFDEITSLSLGENCLRDSGPYDEVWVLAQARTVTTLRQLDRTRNKILLRFLGQADLLFIDDPVQILSEADLEEVNLSKANLSRAYLNNADLSEADLSEADLIGASLRVANLEKADLTEAKLHWANLSGANLSKANLFRASLIGADLSAAVLRGADLTGANLFRANLIRANLTEATLFRANLIEADLSAAFYDDETKWPDGFTPPLDAIKVD